MSALITAAKHSSEAGGRVRSSVARSTELWKQGALSFSEQTRRFPKMLQIDLVPAAERYFDFVQRTVGIDREGDHHLAGCGQDAVGCVRQTSGVGGRARARRG